MPYLLAGKCGGSVKTGRMLSFADNLKNNHLMISMLRAFGYDDNQFGDPTWKGPLPGKGLAG